MDLQNIIVATDLSENCQAAATWASQLKELTGARIIVEHVVEISVSSWLHSAYEILDDPDLRDEAEKRVGVWYHDAVGDDPDEVVIRVGSCLQQLIEEVDAQTGNSILVMSMTGKGAVQRFLLGSTTVAVASQPPCPVVVVHPDHEDLDDDRPVLAGTDFSRHADEALLMGGRFAGLLGVPLEVIHANAAPHLAVLERADIPAEMLQRDAREWAEVRMKSVFERRPELQNIDHDIIFLEDDPALALVEFATERDANLMVMGHSGETPFVQSVLGSTVLRFLKSLPCTLIITPPVPVDPTDIEPES